MPLTSTKNTIYGRQIAFAAAFLLPASKLLEAPSLLARYAAGDLLAPALLHFLLQGVCLWLVLWLIQKSELSLGERIHKTFGKAANIFYIFFALYYLFAATLPLLDLEKFTYSAFSDTEPSLFVFASFFFLSAFVCTKGIKSVGRCADLCLFLFVFPFCALLIMGAFSTDLTHLLPLFGTPFKGSMYAFTYTFPHFSDLPLLLPLLLFYKPKKSDTKKILWGYGAGAIFSLVFLAVFFGIYASIAPREHYAFSKIAQYFPALNVIGRIDLMFTYLLSIVLLYYTCLPLQYTTELLSVSTPVKNRTLIAFLINAAALVFTLFGNKHYNAIYAFFCEKLFLVFTFISYLPPILLLFLPTHNQITNTKKESKHAKHA
ncbi:MAG: GerAB/ArcD/ProY family transporter [Clostridia bacterium]|nr:GerAB/ArcD/ProY family transporter [Clostridia bacterium]